nr:fibronectin type III domain-containing protein [Lachnospiraceae bacterium]
MKRVCMKRRWMLAVVVLCFAMCLQYEVKAAEPYEKIANSSEWEVLKIVNRERLSNGKDAICMFKKLQSAAGTRATELKTLFSHSRPDGSLCFTALDEGDIYYMAAGENIAAGQDSASSVMNDWMNSPGHRANILTDDFSHIGIGYCTGGAYGTNWSQLFVGGCTLKSIAVNDVGTKSYAKGTSINDMGRYLIVKCNNHGTGYVPVIKEMCKGYSASETGTQTVTVTYRNKKVKMTVKTGTSSSVSRPKKVKDLKAYSVKKTSLKLKWKKTSGKGYEIWRATSKNGKYKKIKTISSSKTNTYRVKKLKSGKKYYFKVRAFKKSNGKKIYGSFSKAVVVKTK